MALGGDTAGLDKLAKDYGPVLAGMPQNDIFRILTRPEKVGQLRDIASVQPKIAEVDMFRAFLDHYRSPQNGENKPAADKAVPTKKQ